MAREHSKINTISYLVLVWYADHRTQRPYIQFGCGNAGRSMDCEVTVFSYFYFWTYQSTQVETGKVIEWRTTQQP